MNMFIQEQFSYFEGEHKTVGSDERASELAYVSI